MKKLTDLFLFLVLEITSIVWAAGVFQLIPSKPAAGLVAGAYFVGFSVFMLFRISCWPRWWQAWTLYPLLFFLFGCTIPMLYERLAHFHQPFGQIRIWGIPGPQFHHLSSSALGLLILVTLAETVAVIFSGRKRS